MFELSMIVEIACTPCAFAVGISGGLFVAACGVRIGRTYFKSCLWELCVTAF